MKNPSLLVSIFIALSIIIVTPLANAQNEGRWYNVEVIIFKRTSAQSLNDESWPMDLDLSYPVNTQYLLRNRSAQDGSSSKRSFQRLASDEFTLDNYRETLRRSKAYRVLYHQAWQQQMQGKDSAPGIVIQGGNIISENKSSEEHRELEGFITLHVARYLHINTDLWLSDPGIAAIQNPVNNSALSTLPSPPSSNARERQQLQNALRNDTTPTQDLSQRVSEKLAASGVRLIEGRTDGLNNNVSRVKEEKTSLGIVKLKQHRRMRSEELHYIDHPLMGVLIYFDPI